MKYLMAHPLGHLVLAILTLIVIWMVLQPADPFDSDPTTDTPAYVEAAPVPVPPGFTDEWPTRRSHEFPRVDQLPDWVSCEEEWWVVGSGDRVGIFKTRPLHFWFFSIDLGPIFVKTIPIDANSPYSELQSLNVGELNISRDLASRLLAPVPSGSCGR